MSFILDALRKSETERQQQAGGEFSSVPSSSGESQSPKWLWMLALLLLVNIAVLLGILLRPDAAPDDELLEAPATVPAETQPAAAQPVMRDMPVLGTLAEMPGDLAASAYSVVGNPDSPYAESVKQTARNVASRLNLP